MYGLFGGFFFCQTSQFRSGEEAKYRNIILPQNFHQLLAVFSGETLKGKAVPPQPKPACWAGVRFGGNNFV